MKTPIDILEENKTKLSNDVHQMTLALQSKKNDVLELNIHIKETEISIKLLENSIIVLKGAL